MAGSQDLGVPGAGPNTEGGATRIWSGVPCPLGVLCWSDSAGAVSSQEKETGRTWGETVVWTVGDVDNKHQQHTPEFTQRSSLASGMHKLAQS